MPRAFILAVSIGISCAPAAARNSNPPENRPNDGRHDASVIAGRLGPAQVAIIVNDDDPLSVRIGEYYQAARAIPSRNLIRIHLPRDKPILTREEFQTAKAEVDRRVPAHVQAYALTWAQPYRVECMSITTAFAAGWDEAYCQRVTCGPTKPSPYFNSDSRRPWNDFQLRPTMSIAALDFEHAKALIDRGVAADGTLPSGTAYLINTSDVPRNVRAAWFPKIRERMRGLFKVRIVNWDYMDHARDVMFYFTGLHDVPRITTNRYLPGAMADHLTSSGGRLTDSDQMSILRWLEAGATGSYGTVTEPCNVLAKFPHPGIAIERYYYGETLIEAYWKSVSMPGQGIFVGEPLAAPFAEPMRRYRD